MLWFTEIIQYCIVALTILAYFHSPTKYYVKFTYYYFCVLFATFITSFAFIFRPCDARNAKWAFGLMQVMTRIPLGIKWTVRGEEYLKKDFPCVAVANHQSALDLTVQSIVSRKMSGFICVAKSSIKYAFFIGINGWLTNSVFLDRSKGAESRKKLLNAAESLHKSKATFWLFPEGTRSSGKGDLLPFKIGAFEVALHVKLPILPIVISPYTFIDHKNKVFDSGEMIVSILAPVPTTEDNKAIDVSKLVENVWSLMNKEYQHLSQELSSATTGK